MHKLLLILSILLVGCGSNPKPQPSTLQPPPTLAFDVVACRDAVVDNYCTGMPATVRLHVLASPDQWQEYQTDANGYVYIQPFPDMPDSDLEIRADGYHVYGPEHLSPRGLVETNAKGLHNFFRLTPLVQHIDPDSIPVEQKLAVRGSMWTARANVPYGPRPSRDSNIWATVFVDLYDSATRLREMTRYAAKGYTHAVVGPVQGNDCYHGLWPCRIGIPSQTEWDAYLDSIQENFWDRGVIPVYFAKPDGWERAEHATDMDALDALYRQPRAQKLLGGGIIVYPGWEPSGDKYGWSNAMYVKWLKRGHDVFPRAIHALHTVSDLDAPTGLDDDRTFPAGQGNALSWVNAAPYVSLWLDQLGGYINEDQEVPSPTFLQNVCDHVRRVKNGFQNRYAGWPDFSERGATPIRHIVAEYAAYGDTWWNWDERYAQQIGDHAMSCGADGYLDGGTVPVGVK